MKIFPGIENRVLKRPGTYKSKTNHHYIPDNKDHNEFWSDFYKEIETNNELVPPIDNMLDKVNPYFGHFGLRWHPINFTPKYFHIGIDITEEIGTKIKPITHGLLEYAGHADVNGNYILISHPDIITKDGFVLYSSYMHCKETYLGFNLLQKIAREYISKKNKFSNIEVNSEKHIATVGDTGNKLGVVPHLHLQLEFIHKSGKRIAISPLEILGYPSKTNLTANLKTEKEFIEFYKKYENDLNKWYKFWSNKIK